MKLQGILELAEFRQAGNIGKRDDGWLDAALKLECSLYDMLVLDAVGSAQVVKLQLRMRKLDAEVSELGLLLVGILAASLSAHGNKQHFYAKGSIPRFDFNKYSYRTFR